MHASRNLPSVGHIRGAKRLSSGPLKFAAISLLVPVAACAPRSSVHRTLAGCRLDAAVAAHRVDLSGQDMDSFIIVCMESKGFDPVVPVCNAASPPMDRAIEEQCYERVQNSN